jgi:hypothetical protein
MAYGQSSGTTNYDPFASDLVIDAFGRCQVFDIQSKHMQSARRSLNLLLTSSWSNKGLNLWKVVEVVVPLIPGVILYNLTRNISAVYDTFRRQYQMNAVQNYPVAVTTNIGSPKVTVAIPGNSSPVGSYVGIQVQLAAGGLVLYGFYLVTATPTANSVTFDAGALATGNVVAGGAVPQFTTTMGSQNVSVLLPAHGFAPGQPFNVPVSTTVGGIQIFGSYTVQTVTDANNFVIQANANALSGQSVYENGGQASIATQNQVAPYSDISTTQLSRNDYVAQANKTAPGAPTTLWVNKQIIPQFSVYPVTDNTGPYEMHLWCMQQIQDVNPSGGQTLDLPPRFYYALVLDLARDLSMTYAKDRYAVLKQEATEAWAEAEASDVEPVSTWILPSMPSGLN